MQHPNFNPPIKSVCTTAAGATPTNPVVIVETYYKSGLDSTTGITDGWYRKYSDGRIEQGGFISGELTRNAESTHSLVTSFTDSNVAVFLTVRFSSASLSSYIHGGLALSSVDITNSTFTVHCDTYTSGMEGFYWEASGR